MTMASESVHMRPALATAFCIVHEWPTEGLALRLIHAMRASHRKGGVNVCRECIHRAKEDADETRRTRSFGEVTFDRDRGAA